MKVRNNPIPSFIAGSLALVTVLLAACSRHEPDQTGAHSDRSQTVQWKSETELVSKTDEIVFFRNYRNPRDPRFKTLDRNTYRLGTASVIPPSETWQSLAESIGISGDVSVFPLVFADQLRAPGGSSFMVVAQLSHRFSGDGYLERGPEIWMQIYSFEVCGESRLRLAWNGEFDLGTLQNACVFAGTASHPDVTAGFSIKIEFGDNQTGKPSATRLVHCTLRNDGAIQIARPAGLD